MPHQSDNENELQDNLTAVALPLCIQGLDNTYHVVLVLNLENIFESPLEIRYVNRQFQI